VGIGAEEVHHREGPIALVADGASPRVLTASSQGRHQAVSRVPILNLGVAFVKLVLGYCQREIEMSPSATPVVVTSRAATKS
jgi:hypothetical protein